MRNIDRIRQMSLEELASYFVKDETIDFTDPCYSSPSGDQFLTEVDAINDCIEWLNKDYYDDNSKYDDGSPKCCFGETHFGRTCDLNDYKEGKPYKQRTHYKKKEVDMKDKERV